MNRFRSFITHAFLVLLAGIVFFAYSSPAFAQDLAAPTSPFGNENLSVVTQELFLHAMSAVACQLTGMDPQQKDKLCITIDPKTQQPVYAKNNTGGMIGMMETMIVATYTPPAHTHDFIAYMSNNFGIAKTAHAQVDKPGRVDCNIAGIGYCGLIPLINIWTAFRNLAFFLFVVVFTLIGMAVMLRIKIDPRTVMTLENQIPNVIIGLILITFSYAIAGFLIDMMYVAIYVIFSFFTQPGLYPASYQSSMITSVSDVQKSFQGDNPFGIYNNLVGGGITGGISTVVWDASGGAGDIVANIFSTDPSKHETLMGLIFGGLFDLIRNLLGNIFSWVTSIGAFIVLAVAVLFALFRLWFALIYAYIYILIDVIVAPLWIMAGVFPGSSVNFESWMRDLLARLSAFPTVIAMFLFGRLFMYAFLEQANPIWVAPLVGNPVRNGGDFQPISSIIAVGIVLMTPAVVKMTTEFFKAPQFKWSATIGQSIGSAIAPAQRVGGAAIQGYTTPHYDTSGRLQHPRGPIAFAARLMGGGHG